MFNYHYTQKTWSPKRIKKKNQIILKCGSYFQDPLTTLQDVHLPLGNLKRWEGSGGTFAMPSPPGSLRMETLSSTRDRKMAKDQHGNFQFITSQSYASFTQDFYPLFNLTHPLSFHSLPLILPHTGVHPNNAVFSFLVGPHFCAWKPRLLTLTNAALDALGSTGAHTAEQTLLMLSEAGETFPNSRCFTYPFPAPQQPRQHRSSACFEMAPWCRIVLWGGNRSVFHTVPKEESELHYWQSEQLRSALTSSMSLASTAVPPFGNHCSESINPAPFSASHASKESWEAVATASSCPPAQLAARALHGSLGHC